jgi:copper(I)-binding protein
VTKALHAACAASVCLALFANAAFAHDGLVHEGCDPHATFTAGGLTLSGAFARAMLPNAPSAGGYVAIANGGAEAARLTGATSDAAQVIQFHQMSMDGDVMKMGEVEGGIEIPAGETVALAPSGLHMMFMGIGKPFKEGECVEVVLHFEQAGDVPVVLSIGGAAADAPPEMQMENGAMDPNMSH